MASPGRLKNSQIGLDGRPNQMNVLEAPDEAEPKTIRIVFVTPDGRESDDVGGLNISNYIN